MMQTNGNVVEKQAMPFDFSAESFSMRKVAATDTVDDLAGILHKYANPALIPCENEAWEKAVKEKHVSY